jgi:hypothetical protein
MGRGDEGQVSADGLLCMEGYLLYKEIACSEHKEIDFIRKDWNKCERSLD